MSRVDLQSGRKNQKLRTRRALLAAARTLMEQGTEPSLDAVASEAMVSRATAYRYFASADQLILEATLDDTLDIELADFASTDPAERTAQVQERLYDHAQDHEPQFRLFLSSLHKEWVESDGDAELRGGRRLPMIERALEPVRDTLDEATYRRLVYALAGMMGIESLTVMRDVCELDHDAAKATMNWAVRTLIAAVIDRAAARSED